MEPIKDASHLFEHERLVIMPSGPATASANSRSRRLNRCRGIATANVQDTFYVIEGHLRLFLREPKEEVQLGLGDTYSVRPRRPRLVTNAGDRSATFLVLQGIGEYDYVPLV